jgi:NADH:ubiquinone oxidoreductase subunit 3 (subunit A)
MTVTAIAIVKPLLSTAVINLANVISKKTKKTKKIPFECGFAQKNLKRKNSQDS